MTEKQVYEFEGKPIVKLNGGAYFRRAAGMIYLPPTFSARHVQSSPLYQLPSVGREAQGCCPCKVIRHCQTGRGSCHSPRVIVPSQLHRLPSPGPCSGCCGRAPSSLPAVLAHLPLGQGEQWSREDRASLLRAADT